LSQARHQQRGGRSAAHPKDDESILKAGEKVRATNAVHIRHADHICIPLSTNKQCNTTFKPKCDFEKEILQLLQHWYSQ
jgi:hypothetical protein